MNKILTGEDVAKMTPKQKQDLASRMFNSVKFCGSNLSSKEKNNIIISANPRWSRESLNYYLFNEEVIITAKNEVKIK